MMAYRQPCTWDELLTAFRRNVTTYGADAMGLLGRCGDPDCDARHIILLSESGRPSAVCSLLPRQIEGMLARHNKGT
jgi:hypothetical protein